MIIEIPKELQNEEFRFILLRNKEKLPIEEKWQSINNYKFNDEKLLKHINQGGNYGIVGGFGNLIFVDSDNQEISELMKLMPETLTIKTGSEQSYKKHYYYITENKISPIRLSKEKLGDLGDIRSTGQYVVGPNSVHPSGGLYKIEKSIPITKISEKFVESIFKKYMEKELNTEDEKEYQITTKKRKTSYVNECLVPDYCINNKLKEGGSKNWLLFPYIVDILYNRDIDNSIYEKFANKQDHDIGAIRGWVKMAKEGHLAKSSCEKMQTYLKRYYPELIDEICGNCKLKKVRTDTLNKAINVFMDKRDLAKQFLKIQPLHFDIAKIWWIWNYETFSWEMIDETDILNAISKHSSADTISSKEKTEILEALRQNSRLNKPREIPKNYVQFRDKIIDIENDKEYKANPEYFTTNPIPWKIGESEDTPEIDKLFRSWVGEEHKEELYEVLAFSIASQYFIHRIICLTGTGSNGKGTFQRLLLKFIGDSNTTSTSFDLIAENSRFESARFYKKLVCLMGETNFNSIKKTELLKKLTGEDLINGEIKRKELFNFVNFAKLIMNTNSLPVTEDKTDGFYRRWKLIDFPNQFPKEKDVISLISDQEFENLSRKSIRILKKLWKERQFLNDENFEERKKRYEEKSNPLTLYIKEECDLNPNFEMPFFEFYEGFKIFLEQRGYRVMSKDEVGKLLSREGFEKINKNKFVKGQTTTWRYIIGLTFKKKEEIPQIEIIKESENKDKNMISSY